MPCVCSSRVGLSPPFTHRYSSNFAQSHTVQHQVAFPALKVERKQYSNRVQYVTRSKTLKHEHDGYLSDEALLVIGGFEVVQPFHLRDARHLVDERLCCAGGCATIF